MLDRLYTALIASENLAADDLLLEALKLGNDEEREMALNALIERRSPHGLEGVVARFSHLSETLRIKVLESIGAFHSVLRECGRHHNQNMRIAAMQLIAIGRQGKLAFVLSENLHNPVDTVSKTAVESLVALARWTNMQARQLQRGSDAPAEAQRANQQLQWQRTDIEVAVVRALSVYRGRYGQDLVRAALLLADHAESKTLAIINTPKHGGQSAMVRRLQQSPASEHVDAFLLAAAVGGLRANFAVTWSRITDIPAQDALLRRWYWLRNNDLASCLQHITRGPWLDMDELKADLERRKSVDMPRIAEWVNASGAHEAVKDALLTRIASYDIESFPTRLAILRMAMRRTSSASTDLIKHMLADTDERIQRMAARELVRRRTPDAEQALMPLVSIALPSVRAVIGRVLGREGFESYWQRHDRLQKAVRKAAGKAVFGVLPDALERLRRKMTGGDSSERLRALQIAEELNLADDLTEQIIQLCSADDRKVRSKAVQLISKMNYVPSELLLDKVLVDEDPRVRANAIEVLEQRKQTEYLPMLAQRARSNANRERANAIKALHAMKVKNAGQALKKMLGDQRAAHRISALWALRSVGVWQLLAQVADLAKNDADQRVRRYAAAAIRHATSVIQTQKRKAG